MLSSSKTILYNSENEKKDNFMKIKCKQRTWFLKIIAKIAVLGYLQCKPIYIFYRQTRFSFEVHALKTRKARNKSVSYRI